MVGDMTFRVEFTIEHRNDVYGDEDWTPEREAAVEAIENEINTELKTMETRLREKYGHVHDGDGYTFDCMYDGMGL
jgi:hypothetical protein